MVTRLKVRVIPNARKNAVVSWTGDELRIKIKAPAIEGRANAALIEYLSELADVPRSRIHLKAGEKARIKVIEMEGMTGDEAAARIRSQVGRR
jgi:uncharacterized protein